MANEWYRKTSWTKEDQDDFFKNLNRKKDKSQDLFFQACTLYKQKNWVDSGIDLFNILVSNPVENKCYITSGYIIFFKIWVSNPVENKCYITH